MNTKYTHPDTLKGELLNILKDNEAELNKLKIKLAIATRLLQSKFQSTKTKAEAEVVETEAKIESITFLIEEMEKVVEKL